MSYYALDIYSGELYHFGTQGMKWGIRRYQNPDGSLTPEGYIHYGRKSRKLGITESHLKRGSDYGRGHTSYNYEKSKGLAPIYGAGVGLGSGISLGMAGAPLAKAALIGLSSGVLTGGATVTIAGATLIGEQLVNKLMMNQHKKISAKKKAIDTKLSQYENSQKKKI